MGRDCRAAAPENETPLPPVSSTPPSHRRPSLGPARTAPTSGAEIFVSSWNGDTVSRDTNPKDCRLSRPSGWPRSRTSSTSCACATRSGASRTPRRGSPRPPSPGSGTTPTTPTTTGDEFGDLVLVPFPFTDQSTSKRRPAVVVSSDSAHPRAAGSHHPRRHQPGAARSMTDSQREREVDVRRSRNERIRAGHVDHDGAVYVAGAESGRSRSRRISEDERARCSLLHRVASVGPLRSGFVHTRQP